MGNFDERQWGISVSAVNVAGIAFGCRSARTQAAVIGQPQNGEGGARLVLVDLADQRVTAQPLDNCQASDLSYAVSAVTVLVACGDRGVRVGRP